MGLSTETCGDYREGNCCADHLAKISLNLSSGWRKFEEAPLYLRPLLSHDVTSVSQGKLATL